MPKCYALQNLEILIKAHKIGSGYLEAVRWQMANVYDRAVFATYFKVHSLIGT